jgi:hypothetical protein
MSRLALHDARGPFPRGQNVQLDRLPNSIAQDFLAENGLTSLTEDNVSVFRSDRCVVRRGLARDERPISDLRGPHDARCFQIGHKTMVQVARPRRGHGLSLTSARCDLVALM